MNKLLAQAKRLFAFEGGVGGVRVRGVNAGDSPESAVRMKPSLEDPRGDRPYACQ